ncbi:MAG TPA: hypothetical protein VHG10_01950 [Glycomyces sp.]|nr:hypothetical protein [Glycomyces sp.]
MKASRGRPEPGRLARPLGAAVAAVTVLFATACSNLKEDMEAAPPEAEYTQAEAYVPMEAAAAESVAALEGFPGFEKRSWTEMPCSHNGVDDPDYTKIEIRYLFALPDSETDLVREQFVDALRDHWTALGYRITTDDSVEDTDRTDRNLVAVRDDGISLWYAVGGYVGLFIGSGCVPVSDTSEIEYIAPAGGIEPGGPNDRVSDYFPGGIPVTHEAVAPFESPDHYDDAL